MEKLQLDGSVYAKRNGGFSLIRSGGPSHIFPSNVSQARLLPTNNFKLPLRSRPYTKDNVIRRSRVVSFKQSYARVAPYFKHKPIGATRWVHIIKLFPILTVMPCTHQSCGSSRGWSCSTCKSKTDACSDRILPFLQSIWWVTSWEFFSIVRSISLIGCCNKKNSCKYIHDSRKIAVCPKFLKGGCDNPKCLLSHKHDQVAISMLLCLLGRSWLSKQFRCL